MMHPDPPRTTALRQWAQDQQAMSARIQGALLQADGHAQSSEEIAHRAEAGPEQVTCCFMSGKRRGSSPCPGARAWPGGRSRRPA